MINQYPWRTAYTW